MMYTKKISEEQFILDCVCKAREIAGLPKIWNTWEELVSYSKENREWFVEPVFTTIEQYSEWKSYFLEHAYDHWPKRITKKQLEKEFSWFSLQYGPKFDFDTTLLY